MQKALVIVGAGDHAKVVLDTAKAQGWHVEGFVDNEKPVGRKVNRVPIIGNDRLLAAKDFIAEHVFVVAISHQATRRRLSMQIRRVGGGLATVVYPTCIISEYAVVGEGSMLIAGSIVNANARIGSFCLLNTNCTVDHDTILGDNVQIGPGANLSGRVCCSDDVVVGAGAVVTPGVNIATGAIVGAGAVVIRDVAAGKTVVGNPAVSKS